MIHALLLAVLPTVSGLHGTELHGTELTPLEQALGSVREHQLRADLSFLASEALGGRDTPSPELRIAALYLRNRVQRLGFEPGAKDGWFHDYPLHSWRVDPQGTGFKASSTQGEESFRFGRDYYVMLQSHVGELQVEGAVVCVGTGKEEELEGLDLEGKWALLLDRGHIPKRPAQRCLAAGAAGVICTPGPDYSEKRKGYAEKYQKRSDAVLEPSRPTPRQPEGGRRTGTPWVMLTRDAARRLFALTPEIGDGFPVLGQELELRATQSCRVLEEREPVSNVCAFWPGSDPELSKEVMILSAHYDHVGTQRDRLHPGADDNASGTSGLLAVADALVAYGPLKRSVLLLWVSGEEKGLWGSEVWTKDPWLPGDRRPVLDINMDMIGRTEADELYITPSRGHEAFNPVAEAAYTLAPLEGFPELESQDEYWRRSDHMNFNDNLGIPVVFLSTGDHPDYHRPGDTADKIEYAKTARVVRLVVRLLDELQDDDLTP